ncbi:hypothetical protein ABFT23_15325 [Nocardioides sp. C4-1]|uniref:hypothetical protein n=1 Tax=Nocardioides sp. C4-1 TaxID=3151851 RepID=UPI0032646E57
MSRRTALGAVLAAGAAGAAGCSLDSLDPTSDDPTMTPSSGVSTSGTAPGDGSPASDGGDDAALVGEVLSAIALAHRTARANVRVHPQLTDLLRPFETLHAAHGAELGTLPTTTGRVSARGEDDAAVRARIGRTEQLLQRRLVAAAGVADSGPLALTFASMAGAVAQLRTTL